MVTVKCPHCSTALKLRQAPPAGKVKCPKCSNVVPVRVAAGTAPARRPSQPLDPDDEGFDFGRINFPSASPVAAVSQFPTAGMPRAVYDGPIPGDPLEALAAENSADQPQQAGASPAKKKKTSPLVIIGALGGVGVLVIGVIVAAVMFGGSGGGSGGDNVDVLAALKATAPSGYQAVGHQGVVALMPKGSSTNGVEKLPTVVECTGIQSTASGSFFFLGAMNGGTREIDALQMTKKAERQLGGDILGNTPMERNGYKGIRGKLDGSLFVPNMMVELYHVDGRFVILGCAPASFEASTDVQMSVDRKLEEAEQTIFYDSFKIGPKPSGLFW